MFYSYSIVCVLCEAIVVQTLRVIGLFHSCLEFEQTYRLSKFSASVGCIQTPNSLKDWMISFLSIRPEKQEALTDVKQTTSDRLVAGFWITRKVVV